MVGPYQGTANFRKKHLKNVDCEADKEVSSDMCQNTEKVKRISCNLLTLTIKQKRSMFRNANAYEKMK